MTTPVETGAPAERSIDSFVLAVGSDVAVAARIVADALPIATDEQLRDEGAQAAIATALTTRVPGWGALTAAIARRFDADGLVLVRGLAFDAENRLLVGLLSALGRVVAEGNPAGQAVYDLVPIERPPERPDFELFFHTGSYFYPRPHEILALLCVRPGSQGGGISKLARLDTLLETMRRQGQAAAIDSLTRPVLFKRPRRSGGGYVEAPILAPLATSRSRLQVRFERRRVLGGGRGRPSGYAPDLLAAIAAFEAAANAPESRLEYRLRSDELLIVDNRRVLHARGPVPGGLVSGRHLKRVKAYRP